MISTQLTVYKDVRVLVSMVVKVCKQYSREFKFSLGTETMQSALHLFKYIILANMYKENRVYYLNGFISEFVYLQELLNIAEESGQISTNRHARMFPIIEKIGRQITAWKNSTQKSVRESGRTEGPTGCREFLH